MNFKTTWSRWLLGVVAVLALALATAAVPPQVSEAAVSTQTTSQTRGWGDRSGGHDELLAEALGISVEALQSAGEAATAAAIDQAVSEGLITEAQASAQAAALAQAVEDGRITQAQAEQMTARQAVHAYLQDRMQTAYSEAVEQGLADGVITQAQADQLLENGAGIGEFGGQRGAPHAARRSCCALGGGWGRQGPSAGPRHRRGGCSGRSAPHLQPFLSGQRGPCSGRRGIGPGIGDCAATG
jgi:hypothetical protein